MPSSTTDIKVKGSVGTKTTSKSGELNVTYGHNTGRWMPWVKAASSISESGSDETKVGIFGVGISLNFIENQPGNDLVPYASLGIGGYSEEFSDGVSSVEVGGPIAQFELGLIWFPFGEIAALTIGISSTAGDLDVTGGTAPAAEVDVSSTVFSVGYALAF